MYSSEKEIFDELINDIGEWGNSTFPKATQKSIIAHLKSKVNKELTPNCNPDELANIFILLAHLVQKRGLSLYDEVISQWIINKKRKRGKQNDEGFWEHLEDKCDCETNCGHTK